MTVYYSGLKDDVFLTDSYGIKYSWSEANKIAPRLLEPDALFEQNLRPSMFPPRIGMKYPSGKFNYFNFNFPIIKLGLSLSKLSIQDQCWYWLGCLNELSSQTKFDPVRFYEDWRAGDEPFSSQISYSTPPLRGFRIGAVLANSKIKLCGDLKKDYSAVLLENFLADVAAEFKKCSGNIRSNASPIVVPMKKKVAAVKSAPQKKMLAKRSSPAVATSSAQNINNREVQKFVGALGLGLAAGIVVMKNIVDEQATKHAEDLRRINGQINSEQFAFKMNEKGSAELIEPKKEQINETKCEKNEKQIGEKSTENELVSAKKTEFDSLPDEIKHIFSLTHDEIAPGHRANMCEYLNRTFGTRKKTREKVIFLWTHSGGTWKQSQMAAMIETDEGSVSKHLKKIKGADPKNSQDFPS